MKSIKQIGLVIILSIIGFLIKDIFFSQSLSQLNMGNTQLISHSINGEFKLHLLFSLSIGIIPLLYLLVESVAKIQFQNQGLATLAIIICFGVLFWQFRIVQLNTQLQKLPKLNLDNEGQHVMDIQNLNFALYLLFGFIFGAILSSFIYRKKNKTIIE